MVNHQIVPKIRHHKASGRAYVWHDSRRVYLGKWGTPEAMEAHRRWASEMLSSGSAPKRADDALTVVELLAAFAEAHLGRYGPSHWSN